MTYVLIHGAASDSWYWHRIVPLLEQRGHRVVAVDLPVEDDQAGLAEYADAVVRAVDHEEQIEPPLIVVAQSMGAFTAPLVCGRLPVDLIVLVAPMVPRPGESAGEWWENTGWEQPEDFDIARDFFHDVPPEVTAEAFEQGERRQSARPFAEPWPLDHWPAVRTRVLLCRHDRFFPADFQRRVARQRLGIVPDEMDGGHLPALARPEELVARLEAYRRWASGQEV